MRGLKESELDRDAVVDNTVAKNIDGAANVDLGCEPFRKTFLRGVRIAAVSARKELLPGLGLGRADKRIQLSGIQTEHPVKGRRLRAEIPTGTEQRGLNRVLESLLTRAHAAT